MIFLKRSATGFLTGAFLVLSSMSVNALSLTDAKKAVTVSASSISSARAAGWGKISKGRIFRSWRENTSYKVRKVGANNAWYKVQFTGGNGRVWYIHLTASKKGKKYAVTWCPSPSSSKSRCKW